MSWAGKRSFKDCFKSLFPQREQALSSLSLSARELREAQRAVDRWVKEKAYRLPDRSLTAVSRRMGICSILLHRYCLQKTGMDFRSWRNQLRIEDAKLLLLQDQNSSASHIGCMVGFSDRSNFLRQFQRVTGLTPEQWRRQNA